jgi:5'-3' exonuclease
MATTFKQMTTAEPQTLLIVDSLNLAFRWKHSGAKEFVNQYLQTIDSFKKSFKASKVIITCDGGKSKYRSEIFPEYKANRKILQDKQTPEEAAAFEAFFKEYTAVIDMYKSLWADSTDEYPVLQFAGVEADDIAAYIVKKRKKFNKIWLLSSDRDWDLLVDDHVSRFSYVTRKEITADNWNEHYDYDLEDHISIKCLMGDSGDNVPGVVGVGPKKALDLVRAYGTTYDIINSLPISSKYKYISNLNSFGADNLLRNYQLMDLVSYCADALGDENCAQVDTLLSEYLDGH